MDHTLEIQKTHIHILYPDKKESVMPRFIPCIKREQKQKTRCGSGSTAGFFMG